MVSCYGDCLTEEDRLKIISRIHSLLYWVGEFVPQEEIIQGRKVPLRDIIFRYISNPQPTEVDVAGALELANLLEKKVHRLEEELRTEEMPRTEAQHILDELLGLMRAVDELRHAKGEDLEIKAVDLMKKVNDEKRWWSFVNTLRG